MHRLYHGGKLKALSDLFYLKAGLSKKYSRFGHHQSEGVCFSFKKAIAEAYASPKAEISYLAVKNTELSFDIWDYEYELDPGSAFKVAKTLLTFLKNKMGEDYFNQILTSRMRDLKTSLGEPLFPNFNSADIVIEDQYFLHDKQKLRLNRHMIEQINAIGRQYYPNYFEFLFKENLPKTGIKYIGDAPIIPDEFYLLNKAKYWIEIGRPSELFWLRDAEIQDRLHVPDLIDDDFFEFTSQMNSENRYSAPIF